MEGRCDGAFGEGATKVGCGIKVGVTYKFCVINGYVCSTCALSAFVRMLMCPSDIVMGVWLR